MAGSSSTVGVCAITLRSAFRPTCDDSGRRGIRGNYLFASGFICSNVSVYDALGDKGGFQLRISNLSPHLDDLGAAAVANEGVSDGGHHGHDLVRRHQLVAGLRIGREANRCSDIAKVSGLASEGVGIKRRGYEGGSYIFCINAAHE